MGLSDLFMEGVGGTLLPCLSTKGERPLLEQLLGGGAWKEGVLVGVRDPEVIATQIKPSGL